MRRLKAHISRKLLNSCQELSLYEKGLLPSRFIAKKSVTKVAATLRELLLSEVDQVEAAAIFVKSELWLKFRRGFHVIIERASERAAVQWATFRPRSQNRRENFRTISKDAEYVRVSK